MDWLGLRTEPFQPSKALHPLRPPVEVLWMIPNKEAVKALARRISDCLDADKAPDDRIELSENKYSLQAVDS